jgi:hypothetical protein
MREKKTKSVAIAAIDDAWSQAFASNIVEDADALREQGWKSVRDISRETRRVEHTICNSMRVAVESGNFECKKTRVFDSGKVVLANFYRPIIKS